MYGTNGSDLNWDLVGSLYSHCLDCMEAEERFSRSLIRFLKDNGLTDQAIKYIADDALEACREQLECTGHRILYSPLDKDNFWDMYYGRKKFNKDWYIIHDTNTNFVTLVNNVPAGYLTKRYLEEVSKQK